MKLKNLIKLLFLFLFGGLNAQTDFRPGYIIETTGDTLYGDIDYRGDLLMGKLCKFRDKHKNITEYAPSNLSSFRFIDSKYFTSKEVNGKNIFLEYLLKAE